MPAAETGLSAALLAGGGAAATHFGGGLGNAGGFGSAAAASAAVRGDVAGEDNRSLDPRGVRPKERDLDLSSPTRSTEGLGSDGGGGGPPFGRRAI